MSGKWLQGALYNAAKTKPPSLASVAQIPTLDALASQINKTNNSLVQLQAERDRLQIARDNEVRDFDAERDRLEQARDNELREFDAALALNQDHQDDVTKRLTELREILAGMVRQLGLRVEVLK